MHSFEELIQLRNALSAEIDEISARLEEMEEAASPEAFKTKAHAVVKALATAGVVGDVLANYSDEWARALAAEVILDVEHFDAMFAAAASEDKPGGKN